MSSEEQGKYFGSTVSSHLSSMIDLFYYYSRHVIADFQKCLLSLCFLFYASVVFVKEEDIATYTIKAVDDPRTLNKILHLRPPANVLSFNQIVSLWEKKIGTNLEKTYLLEDELLKKIQESPMPINIILAISHSIFVKGDATNHEIDASIGAEASELYPEVKYTTVDEYLSFFA